MKPGPRFPRLSAALSADQGADHAEPDVRRVAPGRADPQRDRSGQPLQRQPGHGAQGRVASSRRSGCWFASRGAAPSWRRTRKSAASFRSCASRPDAAELDELTAQLLDLQAGARCGFRPAAGPEREQQRVSAHPHPAAERDAGLLRGGAAAGIALQGTDRSRHPAARMHAVQHVRDPFRYARPAGRGARQGRDRPRRGGGARSRSRAGTPMLQIERIAFSYRHEPAELRRCLCDTRLHHYRNAITG